VGGDITIDGVPISKVKQFRYLGLIIQQNGEINKDINQRIRVGWLKWKHDTGVLHDKRMPVGLKGKVYRTIVRPAMLYGSECWALKKTQIQRLLVAEMKMIRWICGYMKLDKIRNEVIRDLVKVAPIEDKMRESRLRWFGHVKRSMDIPVRRCETINIPVGNRGRGRPKKSLDEVIRGDLKVVALTEDMAPNGRLWRDRIKVVDRGALLA